MVRAVVAAAKLIAPHLHPNDPSAGFEWCLEELFKAKLVGIAHDVMMAKAHYFLRSADIEEAASVLKQFERHGGSVRIKAATNLSFLYSLEGNASDAARYSDLVMKHDEYHVQVCLMESFLLRRPHGSVCGARCSFRAT
jgi:intraflagellar transport protein 88